MKTARARCFNCFAPIWDGESHNCYLNLAHGSDVKDKWTVFVRALRMWMGSYRYWKRQSKTWGQL